MAYRIGNRNFNDIQTSKDMKKTLICLVVFSALMLCGCSGNEGKDESAQAESVQAGPADNVENKANATENIMTETKFRITTSKGEMVVKLYDETPLHKENFINLAKKGFYNGILFHRVIKGFMIQVGDPLTKDSGRRNEWGTGGPGYTIPAEFVDSLTHKKGALAAARMGDFVNPEKESSGSQFYIVQSEAGCKHLDGEYTVFGEVVEGLDVIDKIANVSTDPYDCPLEDISIISVIRIEK